MLEKTVYSGTVGDIEWRVAEHPDFIAWAGYVRLPEDHPWRGMMMEDIPARVHGGVTYGPDDEGWIGFDTLHSDDAILLKGLRPGMQQPYDRGRKWTPTTVKWETNVFAIQACEALHNASRDENVLAAETVKGMMHRIDRELSSRTRFEFAPYTAVVVLSEGGEVVTQAEWDSVMERHPYWAAPAYFLYCNGVSVEDIVRIHAMYGVVGLDRAGSVGLELEGTGDELPGWVGGCYFTEADGEGVA